MCRNVDVERVERAIMRYLEDQMSNAVMRLISGEVDDDVVTGEGGGVAFPRYLSDDPNF
jgi:hypothetical protein